MKRTSLTFLLSVIFFSELLYCDDVESHKEARCLAWGRVHDFLKGYENVNLVIFQLQDLKCSVNSECSGISCSGKYENSDFKCDIKIEPCESPIHIQATVSIPSMNSKMLNYSFYNGSQITLPVISLPVKVSLTQHNQSLDVGLTEVQPGSLLQFIPFQNKTFSLPICNTRHPVPSTSAPILSSNKPSSESIRTTPTTKLSSLVSCKVKEDCDANQTCVNNKCHCLTGIEISPGQCVHDANKNTTRACDAQDLHSCSAGEICVQFNETTTLGYCFCRENFSLTEDHRCVQDDPDSGKKSSSVAVSLAIAIPILILIACAVVALFVVKFRLISRCRNRRGIRTYEVVDIGNDDDEPLVT